MPTRLCAEPGCPHPATYRGRCPTHAAVNEQQTNRAGRHLYNTAKWRNTRRRILFHNPLCQCGAIATDVHHITDLADGGDPWATSNLEPLCHSCHSRHTRRDQGASANGAAAPITHEDSATAAIATTGTRRTQRVRRPMSGDVGETPSE